MDTLLHIIESYGLWVVFVCVLLDQGGLPFPSYAPLIVTAALATEKHESLLLTHAKPSVIQAALMAIGMTPGKNASFAEKNPPPTPEEVQKGVDPYILVPPSGPRMFMTVTWEKEKAAWWMLAPVTAALGIVLFLSWPKATEADTGPPVPFADSAS